MIRRVGLPATGIPTDNTAILGAIMEWGENSPTPYWSMADSSVLSQQVHAYVVDTAST